MTPATRIGRLHVLTDETLQRRFSHVELARLAARGGADTVQLREKLSRPTAELVRIARRVREVIEPFGARLVVDDRVDVARAAGAGVHLGKTDMTARRARELLGRDAAIGGTANSLAEALQVASGPVDYLGVGPVFGTSSNRCFSSQDSTEDPARLNSYASTLRSWH